MGRAIFRTRTLIITNPWIFSYRPMTLWEEVSIPSTLCHWLWSGRFSCSTSSSASSAGKSSWSYSIDVRPPRKSAVQYTVHSLYYSTAEYCRSSCGILRSKKSKFSPFNFFGKKTSWGWYYKNELETFSLGYIFPFFAAAANTTAAIYLQANLDDCSSKLLQKPLDGNMANFDSRYLAK